MENLGFWLVVLSPHSTSSTACLFSTCLDWGENLFFFFLNFNKGTFSIWFFPLPEYSLHEQKRIAGGEQSFSLYFKVIDFIMFFFELFNNAHTILIDRISLDNTENLKNCCMHASKDFLHLYKEKMCCSTVAMLMNRTCQAIS